MIWMIRFNEGPWSKYNFLASDEETARKQILAMNPARAKRVEEGKCKLEIKRSDWQPTSRSKKRMQTDYKMLPVRFTPEQIDEIKRQAKASDMTLTEYARSKLLDFT